MLELCLSLRSLLVLPLISVGMMRGKMCSRWCQRSRNIFSQGFLHGKLLTLLKRVRGCTWIRETNVYYFAGQPAFNENDFQMCWLGCPSALSLGWCELLWDVWRAVTILVLLLGRERRSQVVVQIPTTKKITWKACKRIYFLPSLHYHRWIINLVKCRIFSMWPVSTCNPKILAHNSELFKLTKSSPDLLIPAESLLFSFTGRMFFFYGFIASVFQVCLISMCWKHQTNLQ